MELQAICYVLAAVLVLAGIIGIVLPALPGVPLVFGGMLLAAWADGFVRVQWWWIAILALLTVLSLVVDIWSSAFGAKRVGASGKAVFGALAGATVGLFFSPIGLIAGPFIGAVLGELWHGRGIDRQRVGKAAKVGVGTWLGIVFGIGFNIGLACAMLALFAWAWFF